MHNIPQRQGKKHLFPGNVCKLEPSPIKKHRVGFPNVKWQLQRRKRQIKRLDHPLSGERAPQPCSVWRGNRLGSGVFAGGMLAACKCGEAFLQPSPTQGSHLKSSPSIGPNRIRQAFHIPYSIAKETLTKSRTLSHFASGFSLLQLGLSFLKSLCHYFVPLLIQPSRDKEMPNEKNGHLNRTRLKRQCVR